MTKTKSAGLNYYENTSVTMDMVDKLISDVKMNVNLNVNPEFGIELALVIPYAYWLHRNGKLGTVRTSKGMSPFYYFCEDVEEVFKERSLDNRMSMIGVPNIWIHHNAFALTGRDYSDLSETEQESVNGVLDYSQWECPPYRERYKNNEFKLSPRMIFISNKYNIEHGEPPMGYFDIECLINMFSMLNQMGYTVIYKRPSNKETDFSLDLNEQSSLANGYLNIQAEVNGKIITDYELTNYFDNVILFDDLLKDSKLSYNETQLKVMANCENFISVCGGNSILSSLFGGQMITYVHKGKELRGNYFGKDSYFRKLSSTNVFPILDPQVMTTGNHDYTKLYQTMKEIL